jgi:hypothetical protein
MFDDVLAFHDKFMLWVGAGAPVPERARLAELFEALLVTVIVALKTPAAFGVNVTPIEVLWPAAMVTGKVVLVSEKYFVETVALVTVIDAGPEFVALNVRVLVLPAATLPKSSVAAASDRVLDCC